MSDTRYGVSEYLWQNFGIGLMAIGSFLVIPSLLLFFLDLYVSIVLVVGLIIIFFGFLSYSKGEERIKRLERGGVE